MSRPGAAIGMLLLLSVSLSAGASEVSLRTMSFNVRYAGSFDDQLTGNAWFNLDDPSASRAHRVLEVIHDYAPDILGTQEALNVQMQSLAGQDLASGLADYAYYGVGRENGVAQGEFATIFYRADRFTRLDAGTFWLSPTPDVPSIYPGAGTMRIASWVLLEDHVSGQPLLVLNTHFDNVSSAANLYSANLIRQRLPTLAADAPILLTGDLNSTASSNVVRTLMGTNSPGGLQLGDSYREIYPSIASNEATYHAFTGNTSGSRIDFILHSSDLEPVGASIIHTSFAGKYPSDHFPVTAEFKLLIVPEPGAGVLLLLGACALWFGRSRTILTAPCEPTPPGNQRD